MKAGAFVFQIQTLLDYGGDLMARCGSNGRVQTPSSPHFLPTSRQNVLILLSFAAASDSDAAIGRLDPCMYRVFTAGEEFHADAE
jgi:hypothetical protein